MFHTQGPKNNNQPSWQESVIRFFNYIFVCDGNCWPYLILCGMIAKYPVDLMDLMCETWWLCRWISKLLELFVVVGIVPLLALHVERSNKQTEQKKTLHWVSSHFAGAYNWSKYPHICRIINLHISQSSCTINEGPFDCRRRLLLPIRVS